MSKITAKENFLKHQYKFGMDGANTPQTGESFVVCPRCGEHLRPVDIENYSLCPFCSYRFEVNLELEDFLMKPAVDSWMHQQGLPSSMVDNSFRFNGF